MASWATRGDVGFDVLDRVQNSLTVDMIMTPRDELMTCHREDMADATMDRNKGHFSFLPVEDADGCILGLYKAEQWFEVHAPRVRIGEDFERLAEDLMIGANASILEFVKTADERPARLVVSGDRVAGMVTLSDLQRLPVRAALFTLITSLEMAMAERIKTEWPDDADGWLDLLSDNRRKRTAEHIHAAKQEDGFVSEIVSTQLCDKAAIIYKQRLLHGSRTVLERDFRLIQDLRNDIAHANYYAETPEAARRVVAVVRRIFEIKAELLPEITERAGTAKCNSAIG